jgi:hypothetical protein
VGVGLIDQIGQPDGARRAGKARKYFAVIPLQDADEEAMQMESTAMPPSGDRGDLFADLASVEKKFINQFISRSNLPGY